MIFSFLKDIVHKTRHVFLYGVAMAVLVFLLKWLQWKYLITDHSSDIYTGLIAVLFTTLGVLVARQLTETKNRTIIDNVLQKTISM